MKNRLRLALAVALLAVAGASKALRILMEGEKKFSAPKPMLPFLPLNSLRISTLSWTRDWPSSAGP